VKGRAQGKITQTFRGDLTQEMYDQMQQEPDLEYRYPIQIEASNGSRSILDILRGVGK